MTYNRLGNNELALDDLNHLIGSVPTEVAGAYHLRASILFNQHEYRRALPDLDKVIELTPDNAFAFCQRGLVLAFLNRYSEAIRDLDQSMQPDPNNKCLLKSREMRDKAWHQTLRSGGKR